MRFARTSTHTRSRHGAGAFRRAAAQLTVGARALNAALAARADGSLRRAPLHCIAERAGKAFVVELVAERACRKPRNTVSRRRIAALFRGAVAVGRAVPGSHLAVQTNPHALPVFADAAQADRDAGSAGRSGHRGHGSAHSSLASQACAALETSGTGRALAAQGLAFAVHARPDAAFMVLGAGFGGATERLTLGGRRVAEVVGYARVERSACRAARKHAFAHGAGGVVSVAAEEAGATGGRLAGLVFCSGAANRTARNGIGRERAVRHGLHCCRARGDVRIRARHSKRLARGAREEVFAERTARVVVREAAIVQRAVGRREFAKDRRCRRRGRFLRFHIDAIDGGARVGCYGRVPVDVRSAGFWDLRARLGDRRSARTSPSRGDPGASPASHAALDRADRAPGCTGVFGHGRAGPRCAPARRERHAEKQSQ